MNYYEGNHPMGNLGLLQAYRKSPFSLAVDMGRPEQLLPPNLPSFVYQPQPMQVPQTGMMGGGMGGGAYPAYMGGYEGDGAVGPGPDSATDPSSIGAVNGLDASSDAAGGGGGGGAK